ncbi:hypothetical protein ACFL2Q_11635, partial [Thermodesulfobacteriota bacterium]
LSLPFKNDSELYIAALSYFGLVPAALIGADLDRLLMRASQAVESSGPDVPSLENPGLWLGVIMAEASLAGKDKLTLLISDRIGSFGYWLEQLIAESTGKEGKGIIPIESEPPGDPENYARDRLVVYLRLDDEGTYDFFVGGLEKSGHPVVTLRLHTPYDLGREIFRWEFATAVAGAILRINPFDQPNVQESKDLTKKLLHLYNQEGEIPPGERTQIDDPDLPTKLKEFLGQARPGDYVGLNAFVNPTSVNRDVLQEVRAVFKDKLKVATTLGFGPRYLHSTGQFHKGGPDEGLFVQVTTDDPEDIGIPDELYSIGVLKSSQSLGDYEALKRRGRRILRVHVPSEADLPKLLDAAKAM